MVNNNFFRGLLEGNSYGILAPHQLSKVVSVLMDSLGKYGCQGSNVRLLRLHELLIELYQEIVKGHRAMVRVRLGKDHRYSSRIRNKNLLRR